MISLFSAIFLGSLKVPYDEIRRRIVEVDESQLSSEMLEQLLKFIPEPEQLQALAQLKDEIDSLAEPEQFCVVVRNFTLPLSSSPFFYKALIIIVITALPVPAPPSPPTCSSVT